MKVTTPLAEIILVTGGARSGKSSYAEAAAASLGANVLYLATAIAFDDEMRERIARHQAARPSSWSTLECSRDLATGLSTVALESYQAVLLDCLGNLLMRVLFDEIADPETSPVAAYDRVEQLAKEDLRLFLDYLAEQGKHLVVVTNEVGSGIVPNNRFSRYYRDILGRLNAYIAAQAQSVVLLVAGVPLVVKGQAAAPVANLSNPS